MATRYTSEKAPGMAVTIGQEGIYVELPDGMIKVSPNRPAELEQLILDQFIVIDGSVTWRDIEAVAIT